MLEGYIQQFITLLDSAKLFTLFAMVLANLVSGIAVSIYTKTFRLKAIADFLLSRILPYVLGYMTVGIVAVVQPAWSMAVTVVWAFILLALAGAVLANLKEMGISLPEALAGNKLGE